MDSAVDPMIQALRRKLGGNRSLRGVDCKAYLCHRLSDKFV